MPCSLFACLAAGGQQGCFLFLAVMNTVSTNSCARFLRKHSFHFSGINYPRMLLLACIGNLSTLKRNCQAACPGWTSLHIPTGETGFLHPHQHWVLPLLLSLALPCGGGGGGRGWPTAHLRQQRASGQFVPTHNSTGMAGLFSTFRPGGL